ncbi:CHAT domain-containing protein [Suillus lakei]|nr:CHAT domain-containing protein [Suillus lakei]
MLNSKLGQSQSRLVDDVGHFRAALRECPRGDSRSTCLSDLAFCLQERFQQQGTLSDLDEVIELRRAALVLRATGHPDRDESLHNLAINLSQRFRRRGILSDLHEAIELNRAALILRPPDHHCASSLNNLALSLESRFEQQGIISDLNEAIELLRAALVLRPPGYPDRSMFLNNLANIVEKRFQHRGVLSDLDEFIELRRAVLFLRPSGHPNQFISLINLADGLQTRFERQGVLSDQDEAIELSRASLALCPSHDDHSLSLYSLAVSLNTRFQQQGVLSDLDEAIELHRAALALRAPGHHLRPSSLNGLAISLRNRSHSQGALSGLDEATELHRAALELHPPGHPDRSISLNNLAMALLDRSERGGVPSDLDESIKLLRAALVLPRHSYCDRFSPFNNLAISLHSRFVQRGVVSDLNDAIALHQTALELCPPDHPDRSIPLHGLAECLRNRYHKQGILPDLDEAIELHRAALAFRPSGHPERYTSLNNVTLSLLDRFHQQGILSDLNEVVELFRAALALCPPGHPSRSSPLSSLAESLLTRFKRQSIVFKIIMHNRVVLEQYPYRDQCLLRWEQPGLLPDLDEAFGLYSQLSQFSHSVSRRDLAAAKLWATSAEQLIHDSALAAYQTALKFLVQHVAVLASSSRHFDVVRKATSSLAMDAFSCGVCHGALTTAVELVEQGRAVFWTQLAHLRTPLDELAASGDTGEALAEEFKQLSFMLDGSTEDQSPHTRRRTVQWHNVISRIRMLHNFSRFLLPPLFSDLQKAADDGPVIIVNASQYSCDALIIMKAHDPVHISLDIAHAKVCELSSKFQSLTARAGYSDHQVELHSIIAVLRELWDRVVSPIVQVLRNFILRGSRIWWCPTAEFTLLPLHAAGPYELNSHNFSHFYISSYTPTLVALIRARQQVSRDASIEHFVAIGQANPDSDKGKGLRCVPTELATVAQRITPFMSFVSLADSDATVQGALDALSRHQWLHLACHGIPNRKQPFESSFAMRDGPLQIRDIIQSHLQSPAFAFLSACHTTVGDESSPDEAIHLAAAMQFAGFRSVIGSMWSVDDSVANQIVSVFYENLVDDSGRLDCTRAAVALHKAIKTLRKKIPFEQQIVFIHIGV